MVGIVAGAHPKELQPELPDRALARCARGAVDAADPARGGRRSATLVLPFPVELLRFLERATPQASRSRDDEAAMPPPRPLLRRARCRSWTRHRSPTTQRS